LVADSPLAIASGIVAINTRAQPLDNRLERARTLMAGILRRAGASAGPLGRTAASAA
jgi:hypothetical protein